MLRLPHWLILASGQYKYSYSPVGALNRVAQLTHMTHSGVLIFLVASLLLLLYTPVRASHRSVEEQDLQDESFRSQPYFDDEYEEVIPVTRRGFLHSSRLGKREYLPSKRGFLTSSRLG